MGIISSSIKAFVAGKRVLPSVPPGRIVVVSVEEDAQPISRRDGTSSLGLFIEYVDANGGHSERRIACRSYDRTKDILNAWCFERSASRAFRCDRIVSAACTETGEFFALPDLIEVLRGRGLPVRDAGLNAALQILTFLMRCDGIHASEQIALEDAITSYAIRFDGDDAMVELALRQARTLAPDDHDFLKAIRFISMHPDGPALARYVRSQAQRIIDADGHHSADEARFGFELDRALGSIASRS
jgi:hypothetical protein